MILIQTTTTRDGETIQIFLGEIGIKAIMRTMVKEETITKRIIRIKDLKAKVSCNNRTKSKAVEVAVRRILRKYSKELWLNKTQCRSSSRLQSEIWRTRWVKWLNNYQNVIQVRYLLILIYLGLRMPQLLLPGAEECYPL